MPVIISQQRRALAHELDLPEDAADRQWVRLIGLDAIDHDAKVVDAGRFDPGHASGECHDENPPCALAARSSGTLRHAQRVEPSSAAERADAPLNAIDDIIRSRRAGGDTYGVRLAEPRRAQVRLGLDVVD